MGVKIYPYRVKEKAKSMNMKLETLKEGIAVEKEAQSWLSQKFLTLTGSAWDSARSYVSEVQLPLLATTVSWIEAEMAGNKAYQAAAERLPQVDCLDEDQLKRNIQYWQREISYEQSEEDPDYDFIRRLQGYIRDAQAKLDAMSNFVRVTGGIYDRAGDINRILNNADMELNKVQYDQKSMTLNFSSVDRIWLLQFEWVREHEGVKAAVFTDEGIRELSELGFTVEEAITAWQELQERDITRADMARMDLGLVDVMVVWKNTGNEDGKILVTGLLKKQYEVEWGEIHSARDKRRCQSSWHGLIIRITVESWQDS